MFPFVTMGEFGEVSGDDALLRQAILNLARNAAEAAADNPAGGRVIIRGEIDKSGPLQGQRISITDNGPGIPAEALTKIFMPFYTTKANGTGLGPGRGAKNRGPAWRIDRGAQPAPGRSGIHRMVTICTRSRQSD